MWLEILRVMFWTDEHGLPRVWRKRVLTVPEITYRVYCIESTITHLRAESKNIQKDFAFVNSWLLHKDQISNTNLPSQKTMSNSEVKMWRTKNSYEAKKKFPSHQRGDTIWLACCISLCTETCACDGLQVHRMIRKLAAIQPWEVGVLASSVHNVQSIMTLNNVPYRLQLSTQGLLLSSAPKHTLVIRYHS